MYRYFIEGGPLFMGMLSIVFLVILVLAVLALKSAPDNKANEKNWLAYVKSLGLFAFVLGMLGQFLGLFQAFKIIGSGMEISPAIMASGVKVSMITSIYGMIIFLVAYLLWFILNALEARKV